MKLPIHFYPKQAQLVRLTNTVGPTSATKLGYGGALGGGKSGLARRWALLRRMQYPGTTGNLIRRVYKDLKLNHIDMLWIEYPELRKYYRESEKELVLPNGSRQIFMYAETEADVQRQFVGPEFFDQIVDQAEQFSEAELLKITSRTRWPGMSNGQAKTLYMFNPGGPGMEYLRRVFYLREFRDREHPHEYAFLHAYGWDNYQWFRHLMTEDEFYKLSDADRKQLFITDTSYGKEINSKPDHIRIGELEGSFENFSGQYFAGAWDRVKCTLTRKEAESIIQPWWTRWMAQDWGFGDHTAHGWFASGWLTPKQWMEHFGGYTEYPMEVVIEYREHIINQRAEGDLIDDIVKMTPEPERREIRRFFLSEDAIGKRAKQAGANTIGERFTDVMRANGMPAPEPALQDRVNGARFLYNAIRQSNLRGGNISKERADQGVAYFVTVDCPNTISSIPLAIRDDDNIEDIARVPGALWEDVVDKSRYGLYSYLGGKTKAPVEVRAKQVYDSYTDMNDRMMAMREFANREQVRNRLRPRVRPPN